MLTWCFNVLGVLQGTWTNQLFCNAQDRAKARAAFLTLHDHEFWQHARIVFDITRAVEDVRKWGGGCVCHSFERQRGENVRCPKTGRQLPFAHRRVKEFISFCSEEMVKPLPGDFCFAVDLAHQLEIDRQWCWGHLGSFTREICNFLVHLPYSLAYARQSPLYMERCRAEYLAQNPDERHRICHRFFSPDGALRNDVDLFIETFELSDELSEELTAIEQVPTDESRVEGPHSSMTRETHRARCTSRIWHSSTIRLDENIEFWRSLSPADLKKLNGNGRTSGAFSNQIRKCSTDPKEDPSMASISSSIVRSLLCLNFGRAWKRSLCGTPRGTNRSPPKKTLSLNKCGLNTYRVP